MEKEQRIQAILFDFDGVITVEETGSGPITEFIAKRVGLPLEQVQKSYYKRNEEFLCGTLTHHQMWKDYCKEIGAEIGEEVLKEAFHAITLDHEMLQFIRSLKTKYKTALVTDNKVDRIPDCT